MSDFNVLQPASELGERCRSLRCKGMYLNYGLLVRQEPADLRPRRPARR
jgi:hypothetical protein